jgi:arylsulfatase A-like enzyme
LTISGRIPQSTSPITFSGTTGPVMLKDIRRPVLRIFPGWWAALALLLAGCTPDRPVQNPNIILIVADALRPDHMGCYGYGRETTPHLDALAAESVLFEKAYCQMPLTPSSIFSIFSGLHPEAHGLIFAGEDDGSLFARPATGISLLPEVLENRGYCCLAITSTAWLDPELGFGRGFRKYINHWRGLTFAPRINRDLKQALAILPETRCERFFAFLHYYDPHSASDDQGNRLPYYAPEEYIARFGVDTAAVTARMAEAGLGSSRFLAWLYEQEDGGPTPEEISGIRDLYDASIAAFDTEMGRLFESLKAAGIYEDALIIFTADHGQEFMEHGEFIHNQVYEETIRVPLIIRFPRGRTGGRRRAGPVKLLDIFPTVIDYLGLEPPGYLQGESMLPLISGKASLPRYIFARQKSPPEARVYSVSDGRHKLVHDLIDDRSELYDLVSDPGEQRDISRDRPDPLENLLRILLEKIEENRRIYDSFGGRGEGIGLDEDRLNSLRSLGYL